MEALIPRKGGQMPAPRKYPEELRERAVRLVLEAREQDAKLSLNAAVLRIGPRVGVNKDTLRGLVQAGRDRYGSPAGHDDDGGSNDPRVATRGQGTQARQRDPVGGVEFLRAGARPATAVVIEFIDTHKDTFGVEPICTVLHGQDCGIAPSTYYAAKTRPVSARAARDAVVLEHIRRVHASPTIGRRLYGAARCGMNSPANRPAVSIPSWDRCRAVRSRGSCEATGCVVCVATRGS